MAINIKIKQLETPLLQFGGAGDFSDPKFGLIESGPFDLRFGQSRKNEIRIGIIGEPEEIRNAKNWLGRCSKKISSDKNQKLYPDFPGFKNAFHCDLMTNNSWDIDVNIFGNVKKLLNEKDEVKRFEGIVSIYEKGLNSLANMNIKPDVIICTVSNVVRNKCSAINIPITNEQKKKIKKYKSAKTDWQYKLFEEEKENEDEFLLFRDLRRALKAKAMKIRIPIQIGTNGLFIDSIKTQDPATRAWNFLVALYYKGGGVPWRLKENGPETCFVGISFNHLKTNQKHLVFTSIAQAFSSKGDGFAIKGESIPWNGKFGRDVHLDYDQASSLGRQIIQQYREHTGNFPMRVVLHKTSKFSKEEQEGFNYAFENIPIVELINIMHTPVRLLQIGEYPPHRGTLLNVNDKNYLFTTGYIDSIETYNGPHIPAPVEIFSMKNIDIAQAAQELLNLARMNWNTASITGGQPVTFSFARNVGGIMAEFGEGESLPTSFKYYM
jgi:hypothetical protein